MFMLLFVNVISGMLFFANTWYVEEDRAKADRAIASEMAEKEVDQEVDKEIEKEIVPDDWFFIS